MKPSESQNFCRVYELPPIDALPKEFCFGGGHNLNCKLVDWFNPWPSDEHIRIAKEEGISLETWNDVKRELLIWLKTKRYVKPENQYILITDFGEILYFVGQPNPAGTT